MKRIIYLLPLFIYACSSQNEEAPQSRRIDSFPIFDSISPLSVPYQASIVTSEIVDKERNAHIQFTLPKFDSTIAFIDTTINHFVEKTKKDFYASLSSDKHAKETPGGTLHIKTLSAYKTDQRISIILESNYQTTGMMRGFRTYCTINYDMQIRREIPFGDYFKRNVDTGYWPKMINASIGQRNGGGIPEKMTDFSEIKFAFDNKNVYFCFDMFELSSIPFIGAINKRALGNNVR